MPTFNPTHSKILNSRRHNASSFIIKLSDKYALFFYSSPILRMKEEITLK